MEPEEAWELYAQPQPQGLRLPSDTVEDHQLQQKCSREKNDPTSKVKTLSLADLSCAMIAIFGFKFKKYDLKMSICRHNTCAHEIIGGAGRNKTTTSTPTGSCSVDVTQGALQPELGGLSTAHHTTSSFSASTRNKALLLQLHQQRTPAFTTATSSTTAETGAALAQESQQSTAPGGTTTSNKVNMISTTIDDPPSDAEFFLSSKQDFLNLVQERKQLLQNCTTSGSRTAYQQFSALDVQHCGQVRVSDLMTVEMGRTGGSGGSRSTRNTSSTSSSGRGPSAQRPPLLSEKLASKIVRAVSRNKTTSLDHNELTGHPEEPYFTYQDYAAYVQDRATTTRVGEMKKSTAQRPVVVSVHEDDRRPPRSASNQRDTKHSSCTPKKPTSHFVDHMEIE
ncbi:unnamed protein product [Amoebophrya sp. A120]|nr:unnamed protein product [Amoebophrya sp. A120]|eukprot:GSA120T00005890001.1